jgi:hypothetical protein
MKRLYLSDSGLPIKRVKAFERSNPKWEKEHQTACKFALSCLFLSYEASKAKLAIGFRAQ